MGRIAAVVAAVVLLAGSAAAQPMRPPPERDMERERALLAGLCLAAVEDVYRVTTLERTILLSGR